jgi:hypothetical protein
MGRRLLMEVVMINRLLVRIILWQGNGSRKSLPIID